MYTSLPLSQKGLILQCYGRKSSPCQRDNKKAFVVEEEPEVEVVTKTEYIYEDTKCIFGIEPEYQWGEVYRLITSKEVPNMGL